MYKIDQSNLDIFAVAPRAGAGIEIDRQEGHLPQGTVAPRAGAGIEISYDGLHCRRLPVAPRAGAGIEICTNPNLVTFGVSPPVRGRELK